MSPVPREKTGTYSCQSHLLLRGAPAEAGAAELASPVRFRAGGPREAAGWVLPPESPLPLSALMTERAHGCRVYAFRVLERGVLLNGRELAQGERLVELLHAPLRPGQRVSFYCAEEPLVFPGQAPPGIAAGTDSHDPYRQLLRHCALLGIRARYQPHRQPLSFNPAEVVRRSLSQAECMCGLGSPCAELRRVVAIGSDGTLSFCGKPVAREAVQFRMVGSHDRPGLSAGGSPGIHSAAALYRLPTGLGRGH